MIQDKILSDFINYHRHGLEYALKTLAEEYTCQSCRIKHRSTQGAIDCCAKEVHRESK